MQVYAHKCKPQIKPGISHHSATFAVIMKSFFENSSAATGAFFKNSSTSTKGFFTRSTNSTKEFFLKKSVFVKPSLMDDHTLGDPDSGASHATCNSSYAGSVRKPADMLLYREALGGCPDLEARGNGYKTVRAKAESISRGSLFHNEFRPVQGSSNQLEGDKNSTDRNSVPRQRVFTSAGDEQVEDDSISDESVVVSNEESFFKRQSVLASAFGARQLVFTSAHKEDNESSENSDGSLVISFDKTFFERHSVFGYAQYRPDGKEVHHLNVPIGCSQKENYVQRQRVLTSAVYSQDEEASSSASSIKDESGVASIHEYHPQRPLVYATVGYEEDEDEGSLGQDESEAASINQVFGHQRVYASAEYSQDGYEADLIEDENDEASSEDDLEENEGGFLSADNEQNDSAWSSKVGSSSNSESDDASMDEAFGQSQSEFYLSRGNLTTRRDVFFSSNDSQNDHASSSKNGSSSKSESDDASINETSSQGFYLSRGNLRTRQNEDFSAHRSPKNYGNNLFAAQNRYETASDESDAALGYRTFRQSRNPRPRHNEFDYAGGSPRQRDNEFFAARPRPYESDPRNRHSQYEGDDSFIEETRQGHSEFVPCTSSRESEFFSARRSSNRESDFFPASDSRNPESEFHPRASNESDKPSSNAKNRFMSSYKSSFHPHDYVPPPDTTTWFERTKVAIKFHLQKVTKVLWKQDKVDDVLHFLTHVSIFLNDCARGCSLKRLSDIAPEAYYCPINLFRSRRFYFY